MREISEAEFAAAQAESERMVREDPRAIKTKFDRRSGRIVVDLSTGCTLAVPARLIEGLAGASDADLANVQPLGRGFALEWEALDVQVNLAGLLRGVFGSKRYMADLARQGGVSRSPAKVAAARANGAKGGRPRKAAAN